MLGTYVLRLDWQRKEWLDVENLGKKMLFLGYNYSHSSMLVPVDDEVGELSEFSNTIHFARDGQERCVCYFYNFSKYQKLTKGGF